MYLLYVLNFIYVVAQWRCGSYEILRYLRIREQFFDNTCGYFSLSH